MPPIDPVLERELAGTPELAALKRKATASADALYPKPEAEEILRLYQDLRGDFSIFHQKIRDGRQVRFQHDQLPGKYMRQQQDGRRIYTRLSHNEIMRVVAMQCRNDYKVELLPTGSTAKARERAEKQTRWSQNFRKAMERRSKTALRRMVVDNQVGDGLGVWEVYLTDAYDKLDMDERRDGESDSEFMSRTSEDLISAGSPIGLRQVDPLSVFFSPGEEGLCNALIVESRPANREFRALRARLGEQGYQEWITRPGGIAGTPVDQPGEGHSQTVECMRYYDSRWYASFVDGKLVDGPTEHNLPGVPVFLVEGMTTGSPNLSERFQGICWGMQHIELLMNDILTRDADTALTFQKPKVAVSSPADARAIPRQLNGDAPVLRFGDDGAVPYLEPGQVIIDATAGFKAHDTNELKQMALQLWQRSGLNPISQGQSPGSDPAGYTVNTLQSAAANLYEVSLDNEARAWEQVVDFARLMVRDTIRMAAYLSVPMQDSRKGGTEWLALGPEDVDETPCQVTVDPLSDVNRMAMRQSLIQGNQAGFVPRRVVQQVGFGAEDPAAWDDELIEDEAQSQLRPEMVRQVIARVMGPPEMSPTGPGPASPPGPGGPGAPPGALPAPPQPPSVGTDLSGASQSPAQAASSAGRAGQDSGYAPPGAGMAGPSQ